MSAKEISLDELQAEYERLGMTPTDEGLTTKEFCRRWGLADAAVRRRLGMAKDAGWLRVGTKLVEDLTGRRVVARCYQIVLPKTKKTKR